MRTRMTEAGCYACEQEARFHTLPARERVAADEHWRAAHAIETALAGWLVLVPRRHVTTVAGLTDAEAASLGTWQLRLSRALHAVLGCTKTYVAQFAEAGRFPHVHFHVVPRMADLRGGLLGPQVFDLLRRPAAEHVSPDRMDEVAAALSEYLGDD
jgi:diadenosine tetraphosphate (Ap4A) HIT family hydrolase